MHQPVSRHWIFPAKGFVNPCRGPILFKRQILRTVHEAKMGPVQGRPGRNFAVGFGMDFGGFGVGGFKAKTTGHFDRAQKDLKYMKRTAGLKPV